MVVFLNSFLVCIAQYAKKQFLHSTVEVSKLDYSLTVLQKESPPAILCPQRESNSHYRFRRPMLYPLSYEGMCCGAGENRRDIPAYRQAGV